MGYVVLFVHDMALVQWRHGWGWLCFSYFLGSTFECLGLFVVSMTFRAFSTLAYDGYLPVDKSGDCMVQIMDGCSLMLALYLLYATQKKYAHTYQHEHDTMPILPILLSGAVLACFVHGDLNHNIFDNLWAYSLNVEVFQLVPQLYMMAKVGGVVDAATAHFVTNVVLACVCRFTFWMWAVPGCKGLGGKGKTSLWEMELGGLYILIAYLLQTVISLDFMYYYVKAWWKGSSAIYLPKAGEEI